MSVDIGRHYLGGRLFGDGFDGSDNEEWIEAELTGCCFPDARLGERLHKLPEGAAGVVGKSLPMACQDWANTKAAYRFLDNDRVSEGAILAGHFQATADRFASVDGPILVLHDTTDFSYQRSAREKIGIKGKTHFGRDKAGRLRQHTVCGLGEALVQQPGVQLIKALGPKSGCKKAATDRANLLLDLTFRGCIIPSTR